MPNLRTSQGEPITGEMLEALAAESEAGYDPTTFRPRKGGRPSLGSGTSPRVGFRVSPSLYEAAQEQAREEQRTLSELARDLLIAYLRRTRPGAVPKQIERPKRLDVRRSASRRRI
jgi:hypothetical protein